MHTQHMVKSYQTHRAMLHQTRICAIMKTCCSRTKTNTCYTIDYFVSREQIILSRKLFINHLVSTCTTYCSKDELTKLKNSLLCFSTWWVKLGQTVHWSSMLYQIFDVDNMLKGFTQSLQ